MRLLCSLHQCIALRSDRWLLRLSQRQFISVFSIVGIDAPFYASTIRPRLLTRPSLFNFVSDLSSSAIAAPGFLCCDLFSFLEESCAVTKSHTHISSLSHGTIPYFAVQCFCCKSTRSGAGNSATAFPRRRVYFLQFHFYYPRRHAAIGNRAFHVFP